MLVICGGPWVIRKTIIWAMKVNGNIGKTAKIRHFVDLNPLNGLFYVNFIAYPLGADARDILAQFWGVENFVLGLGGPENGSKMAIFAQFLGQKGKFSPLGHPKLCFGGLKWEFCPE